MASAPFVKPFGTVHYAIRIWLLIYHEADTSEVGCPQVAHRDFKIKNSDLPQTSNRFLSRMLTQGSEVISRKDLVISLI